MTAAEKKKNILSLVFRILLIAVGGALTAESILAYRYANTIHLGIIMPFVIGLPLVVIGIFFGPISRFCRKYRFGRILAGAVIAVYALFFLLFSFTTVLILAHSAEPTDFSPKTVIVLGAGIRGRSPTATLQYRLEKALEYYEKDPDVILIVSGGRGDDEEYSEAEVMAAWLTAHGADEERIIVEDRSKTTEENFLFSAEIILSREDIDSSSVAFVTSRFHVFRAERIAKKLGFDVRGIPAREFRPLILNDFMRECAAIVQYYLSGRI